MKYLFLLLSILTFQPLTKAQQYQIFAASLSNSDFVRICENDGWDWHLLNTAASADFLTDQEKNIILVTNMVRSNPPRFAELYIKPLFHLIQNKEIRIPQYGSLSITEGRSLLNELHKQLQRTESMKILYPSPGLTMAARTHANNLQKSNKIDHGSGKNSLENRVNKYGTWQYCIGENISSNYASPMLIVISLLLDDAVKSRSHRKNILDPSFNRIGVCLTTHRKFQHLSISIYACDFIENPNQP